uniref:coniferyl-alcohol dehydrogenase n=1 Tax=Sphingomonas bacterium TaxID=1895847 RepID=UPI00157509C1
MADFLGYAGKRVVIAGCHSGMGEATARLLLELGAEVHGIDYKPCALDLASFTRIDIRDEAQIAAGVAEIGGRIDALFNCAGMPGLFGAMEVMKTNFLGTRALTEAVMPLMDDGGAIASIASTAGIGWPTRLPTVLELVNTKSYAEGLAWCEAHPNEVSEGYVLSKEAVIVWTMALADELVARGIRINCTMPGPTQTPMWPHFEASAPAAILEAAAQPIGRRSTPEEQSGALVFLNSDAASYISGVALPVDGGRAG